jgi:hypothetical protein
MTKLVKVTEANLDAINALFEQGYTFDYTFNSGTDLYMLLRLRPIRESNSVMLAQASTPTREGY